VHWAEVRVEQAFKDVHGEPWRRSASARRNHRTTQGDIEAERASVRQAARVRIACMNEHAGGMAGMLRAGSDTLQGATKPVTLRCSRLDPFFNLGM
jgi:hypothetical protein